MTAPLYQRDPEGWRAYLAEGNAAQARKRLSADALIRDQAGRILLAGAGYKPGWDLPDRMAEANESPDDCLQREVREELALDLQAGPVLVVDWVPPHGPWDDLLAFVFDGGVLTAERIAAIRLLDGELDRYEFLSPAEAGHLLNPRGRHRLHAALAAVGAGHASYLRNGIEA